MPRNLLIVIFFAAFSHNCVAQLPASQHGGIDYRRYTAQIYKLTFTPEGYQRNENISDAVILKPLPVANSVPERKKRAAEIARVTNDIGRFVQTFQKDGFNGFRFSLAAGEKIFGGGERALPLNRRGYRFNFYNNPWYGYAEGADNLNYSVPFLTTSEGYGLFFDNPGKGYADIGKTDSTILEVGFSSGEINVYVIFGKDYQEILSNYTKLTGTQPLPPRWAFGNLMSRFGYTSETQAKDILSKMRSENVPVDAIIFDLFWFGDSIKGTLGNLDWVNKNKWPDPKKMIADFKKENVQTILVTEPFVVKSSINYENSKKYLAVDSSGKPYTIGDFYFGAGGLIDIFRNDAKDWFWSKHKTQMNNGVEAWWGDLGEPEKHPADLYHNLKDLGFKKRLFKADEVHNLYGHTWTKMLYEKYAKEYPQKRLFSLNRSGFAGTQRYSIFPWSGDVSRGWSGLRAQLPIMLGMSMSGIPYIHADAGGFAGGEGDNELYVRWLQFAAFTPIFRPHGTALYEADTAAFSFPSEAALIGEPYRSYAKKAIALRYALLPYNYTLAYKQAESGAPLVSPMYYNYAKDRAVADVGDQYFWGENILVAPVLNKKQKILDIKLPAGKWFYLSDNKIMEGEIADSCSLEKTALFVKEGSFISFWSPDSIKNIRSTGDFSGKNDITTIYYPSAKSTNEFLFLDDGLTKNASGEKLLFSGMLKNGLAKITVKTDVPSNYKNGFSRKIRIGIPARMKHPYRLVNGVKPSEAAFKKIAFPFNNDGEGFNCIEINFTGEPVNITLMFEK